jgi:hypothetical protein
MNLRNHHLSILKRGKEEEQKKKDNNYYPERQGL